MRISDWSSDVCSSDLSNLLLFRADVDSGRINIVAGQLPAFRIHVRQFRLPGLCDVHYAERHQNDHYDDQQQDDYQSATASTAHVGLLCFVSHGPTKQRPSSSIRRAVLRARRMVWRLWERTGRSEEHTSELQSLLRISYVFFFF